MLLGLETEMRGYKGSGIYSTERGSGEGGVLVGKAGRGWRGGGEVKGGMDYGCM